MVGKKWKCCGCGRAVRKDLMLYGAFGVDGVRALDEGWIACKDTFMCVQRQNKKLDKKLSRFHSDVACKVNWLSDQLAGDSGWAHNQVRYELVALVEKVIEGVMEDVHPPGREDT